ncbi:hypothetical protein [Streptosporangium amethystogenes]|uniref:hypothetical protein n=1 Tax=Streptosporangium amethystogenes TaxID=2002 RepID=UPI0004CA3D13|nr:hypothetical protein [Streptosporangium amethystogenes]
MSVHQPWCTDHSDVICWSAPSDEPGAVQLSYTEGESHTIHFYVDGDALPVEDAERIALAILARVALARGASS